MKDALTQRKRIKAKKPVFLAQDTHKKSGIRKRWKRPSGIQSKMRLNKRGYRRSVSSGWRSPVSVRGLSPEGLVPIRVETLAQIEAIDAKMQGALVSGRVSIRTKKVLYDAAKARSITVLNRDAKAFDERYAAKAAEREERKKRLETKRARQERLKKDLEKTQKSGVAAEGLKEGAKADEPAAAPEDAAAPEEPEAKAPVSDEAKSADAETKAAKKDDSASTEGSK